MYFERTEQVEAFGKMYKAKIKELLGVAQYDKKINIS